MYFEAIFNPLQTTDYSAAARDFIGKKIAVQEGWIIKEGPHRGQQCFYLPNSKVGEIPVSDLKGLKNIPYVRWKALYDRIGLDNS